MPENKITPHKVFVVHQGIFNSPKMIKELLEEVAENFDPLLVVVEYKKEENTKIPECLKSFKEHKPEYTKRTLIFHLRTEMELKETIENLKDSWMILFH